MSASITLLCDQQVRDSPDRDLCGSQFRVRSVTTLAQAREVAAGDGWTVNETGDACPGCSGYSRRPARPSLRDRIGWSPPHPGPGLRGRIKWPP